MRHVESVWKQCAHADRLVGWRSWRRVHLDVEVCIWQARRVIVFPVAAIVPQAQAAQLCMRTSQKRRRTHGADEEEAYHRQIHCPKLTNMSIALEYQRHIHRITAFASVHTNNFLDTPLRCIAEPDVDGCHTWLVFQHVSTDDVRVRVVWPVIHGIYTATARDAFVCVIPTSSKSSRPDEIPPSTPWHTFSQLDIQGLQCASCGQYVAHFSSTPHMRALPSDHWEELVDAWMCHGDQRLNVSVTKGQRDVDAYRVPTDDEIWVSSLWLKTSSDCVVLDAVNTSDRAENNFSQVRISFFLFPILFLLPLPYIHMRVLAWDNEIRRTKN